MNKSNLILKIAAALAYVGMVTVNALANALPINGIATGAVSDSYPNLFAPAGVTFSIWGLIYLLLGLYILYQFGLFRKGENPERESLLRKINIYFIVSSLANILWIFAWHYDYIVLTLLFMIIILVSLIKIATLLSQEKFSSKEKLFLLWPFSVYFGWITVATIANATVLLVSLNWNGFGIADYVWTVAVLLVGAIIGVARMLKDKNIAYGLVFVWAYGGILLKHISVNGFNGEYLSVMLTAGICIVVFLAMALRLFLQSNKKEQIV